MYEVGIRQAVLTAIKAYVGAQEKAMEKARLLEAPTEPTAPPMEPGTKEKKEGGEGAGRSRGRPACGGDGGSCRIHAQRHRQSQHGVCHLYGEGCKSNCTFA